MSLKTRNPTDRWYQLTITEMILVVAVAAILSKLNLLGRDVGSGLSIIVYGIPLPFLTHHSAFGMSLDPINLSIDVVSWILMIAVVIGATRRIGNLTRVHPNRDE